MNLINLATLSGFALEVYKECDNYNPLEKQFSYIKANNLNITTLTTELSKCFQYTPYISRSNIDLELIELKVTNYFVLYTIDSPINKFNALIYRNIYTEDISDFEHINASDIKEINILCYPNRLTNPEYIRIHLKDNSIINAISDTIKIELINENIVNTTSNISYLD